MSFRRTSTTTPTPIESPAPSDGAATRLRRRGLRADYRGRGDGTAAVARGAFGRALQRSEAKRTVAETARVAHLAVLDARDAVWAGSAHADLGLARPRGRVAEVVEPVARQPRGAGLPLRRGRQANLLGSPRRRETGEPGPAELFRRVVAGLADRDVGDAERGRGRAEGAGDAARPGRAAIGADRQRRGRRRRGRRAGARAASGRPAAAGHEVEVAAGGDAFVGLRAGAAFVHRAVLDVGARRIVWNRMLRRRRA